MSTYNFNTISLPGRKRFVIPIVKKPEAFLESGRAKSTPEWMINFDGKIIGVANAYDPNNVELFGFTYGVERVTVGHSVNQLLSNSSIYCSGLTVIIQNAYYAPVLENMMNTGKILEFISIVRLGWIGGEKAEPLEERFFSSCFITDFQQILDYVVLNIKVLGIEETMLIKNQQGKAVGNSISSIDMQTSKGII